MSDPSNSAKPDIVTELYDRGLICSEGASGGKVYMLVDDPGVYFDAQQRPVSERDAQRAGFNVPYWRGQRRAAEITNAAAEHAQRIRSESARHLMSEQDKRAERAERLREQTAIAAAKVESEQAKRVQAAADRQVTSWLDQEPPGNVLIPT